ncbi:MAG: hypothetical protein MI724_09350, partial [Spirochaetales bacterium]|nr:hypothetical protein [Spirochaetales bacterium]
GLVWFLTSVSDTIDAMSEKILSRILAKLHAPRLLDTLAEDASGSDLISLMLGVYKRRVSKVSPRAVLRQYKTDRFVPPAHLSQRDVAAFDTIAFQRLPRGFDTVELSPVCPLGTSAVLAPVDQNKVVTTGRNSEVCSDATNVLALEAAARRQALSDPSTTLTKLCTSHRQTRAQIFDGPASFTHFRVMALCTAGRTAGNFKRESEAVSEHIHYYLAVLNALRENGYGIGETRVELIPFTNESLRVSEEHIAPRIADSGVSVTVDTSQRSENDYYVDIRFKAFARDGRRNEHHVVDGGFTRWTRTLLSNNKEFFLGSGLGTERMIACFREPE